MAYDPGMATLVITVLGNDRKGLVDSLSHIIDSHNGSWVQSQMSELGGKFAGIVVATVPDGSVDACVTGLESLNALDIDIAVQVAAQSPTSPAEIGFDVDLVGPDRAGVVHELASALGTVDANILELVSETRDAPMAGGRLFEVQAWVAGPDQLTIDQLMDALTGLGTEFIVEVTAR